MIGVEIPDAIDQSPFMVREVGREKTFSDQPGGSKLHLYTKLPQHWYEISADTPNELHFAEPQ